MLSIAVLLAAAYAASFGKSAPAAPMRISIEQIGDADLSVSYLSSKPRKEIVFASVAGGYRERRWEIATPGFRLERLDAEDRIVRVDGKAFTRVELIAKPDLVRLPKEYQPVVRYGAGGALVYTGHFWPMTGKGGRLNATFDFTPAAGSHVVAFERGPSLKTGAVRSRILRSSIWDRWRRSRPRM
ncbi:MAG: hypothetical protein R3C58_00195 [Parvularculaceae bacterium]